MFEKLGSNIEQSSPTPFAKLKFIRSIVPCAYVAVNNCAYLLLTDADTTFLIAVT